MSTDRAKFGFSECVDDKSVCSTELRAPVSPEHVEADEERDEEEHQAGGHAQPQRQHQAHQAAATVGAEIFYK